ncbi:ribosome biogenesis GTPase Der [bacterium]|nr:ribosome biogenesis GTPase Der [bacterium]
MEMDCKFNRTQVRTTVDRRRAGFFMPGGNVMGLPMVAVIGRPNVGKSTLFNRILKRRLAIEDDQPGVTRDRIHADIIWDGKPFTLVDTGGLAGKTDGDIEARVSEAAETAVHMADKVILLMDGTVGMTDDDRYIARLVQKADVPTVLAVTKLDSPKQEPDMWEFMKLGLGDPVPISGKSGRGVGELLDRLTEDFTVRDPLEEDPDELRLAIVGRPNVGKSSLLNRILGEDRQIVSDVPGTTRDATDHVIRYMKRTIRLVDTAGIRRKHEYRRESLDYFTYLRTLKAIDRAHTVAVLIDARKGLSQYERRIIDELRKKYKGIIVVMNKWDLVKKTNTTLAEKEKEFYFQLPDLYYVPVLFLSALTGHRARRVLDQALEIETERFKRISTSELNTFIEKALAHHPPPSVKGKWLKIKYATQPEVAPPLFAFFLSEPQLMPDSYRRYLERQIRTQYGFSGTPIKIVFKKK